MEHGMFANCECGHCQLIAGEEVMGNCAICHKADEFSAEDIFIVGEFELWAHPECRRDWDSVHELQARLSF